MFSMVLHPDLLNFYMPGNSPDYKTRRWGAYLITQDMSQGTSYRPGLLG